MNYLSTFIRIAPDSPTRSALVPPSRSERKAIHIIQYELIFAKPYEYTQEDVLWAVYLVHKSIPAPKATAAARAKFFAKGQPCLRTSALCKRYGWGFHFDDRGRVALVAAGTPQYDRLVKTKELQQLNGMRSTRAKSQGGA